MSNPDHKATHSEQIKEIQQLAAFLPVTLVKRILLTGLPAPGARNSFLAATLFSDISGFTAMSQELATDGPRGAEELNQVLLHTFTAMINIIHEMGGAVSHFYGDAMSVYFPDEEGNAVDRALACAQMMQEVMNTNFYRVVTNRPPDKDPFFNLTIKIGVGYGRCQELLVGDPDRSLELVLTGTAVDEATAAEKLAASGEVVVSRTAWEKVGYTYHEPFSVLEAEKILPPPTSPILNWKEFSTDLLLRHQNAFLPFIPPALLDRIRSINTELAEHRPVTSIFVQFLLPGDDDDSSAIESSEMGQQLQSYYLRLVEIVRRFGAKNARVNRLLTGDKGNQLHIIFGAPVAPDAPEQAARCALAIQEEMAAIGMVQKIGITVGKVFAGPVGSSGRHEYTVVGDVVNLSARLMQACNWGEIWVDRAVVERVEQLFRFEALPVMQVKGKHIAVTPYRLAGARSVSTQIESFLARWKRPMVGREREWANLKQWMEMTTAGHGRTVGITGGIGVGKSRFIANGVEYWLASGGRGIMGICYQHLSETAYAPWRDVWREFFGLSAAMRIAEQTAVVLQRTQELVPEAGDDAGLWQELLGLALPQTKQLMALDAEVRQKRLFTLIRRCLRAVVKEKPLLILVEGIHWADQASLALLDEISRLTPDLPLLLLFSFRPEEKVNSRTMQQPYYNSLSIAELNPADARRHIAHLIGPGQLPAAVDQQLGLRDREGRESPVNPLFLEEALNIMLGAGILRVNDRVTVNETMLAQMPLPDTIHGLLLARLDRLTPQDRDLLQVAAVIGRQFALEPLRNITGSSSSAGIVTILKALTEAELTRLLRTDPEWIYLFQHALTHEVAYESMPFSRRQTLHEAVADWLVSTHEKNLQPLHSLLAFHFSRAGQHMQALHFAVKAGDDARAIFANREAVGLYKLAAHHLAALDPETNWQTAVHIHLSQSEALRFIGDFNLAIAAAQRAREIAEKQRDFPRMAACYNLLAELKCRQARYVAAEEFITLVTEELHAYISAEELARAYHWGGVAASSQGLFDLAQKRLQQAESLCINSKNDARLARVLESLAFINYLQKNLQQALNNMQRSVALSRSLSHSANIASSLSNISLIQFQLGQAGAALETLDEAIELARESSPNFLAQAIGNRAEILAYLGQFNDARLAFDQSIEMFMQMDDEESLIEVLLLKGYEYHCVRHEWRAAAETFDLIEEMIGDALDRYQEFRARLLLGRALLHIQSRIYDHALSALIEAELLLAEKESVWWLPVAYYLGSLIYAKLNIRPQAEAYIEMALEKLPHGGCPDYEPLIWLQRAQLAPQEDRRQWIENGVTALKQRSRFGDRASCLLEAAVLLETTTEGKNAGLSAKWRREAAQYELI